MPSLPPCHVHVWLIHTATQPPGPWPHLTPAEWERGQRYRQEGDRHRFYLARSSLRQLLHHYTGHPLGVILTTPQGKPFLPDHPLQFNISHTGDWVAIAFAHHWPLGIDIETLRPMEDVLALARRFFRPSEAAALAQQPDPTAAFFTIWTRKEAFLKATGEGLQGLQTVELNLDRPPQILAIDDPGQAQIPWWITDLALPGMAGALVVGGQPEKVAIHEIHTWSGLPGTADEGKA
ncbi:4'-phosphopantetheinyl transferase superfamily protein [Spirulina sp. CCNP1310]|uniref:4'-phosphopantetheinyl transferase family protein n=1 Tax=Spirulina sp. CCNP1310 TaxID=3110249 RepID=UPI002B210347|nr:4'-phosphopantetheinyl transferase superfamily protein [Spirulina sp. CCNP1310]MEA5418712.1 4'-phosphopantetheinyl transferase superfamily protein [Spirulina sp. CCNP1310]